MSEAIDRKQRRRDDILAAAEKVLLEKGFHDTGIADIAAELGIGHGTFYRYFANKKEIAEAVLDNVLGRIALVGLEDDPEASNTLEEYRSQARAVLEKLISTLVAEPNLARFVQEQAMVIDPGRLKRFYEMFAAFTARYLNNGVSKGFLRADLDVSTTSELLVTLIFEGTALGLEEDPAVSRRWMEAGLALMFDGIAPRD